MAVLVVLGDDSMPVTAIAPLPVVSAVLTVLTLTVEAASAAAC